MLLIPVAAGVLAPALGSRLSPVLAAAMGCSSVFVLSSALRLRGFRPPLPPGPAIRLAHELPAVEGVKRTA